MSDTKRTTPAGGNDEASCARRSDRLEQSGAGAVVDWRREGFTACGEEATAPGGTLATIVLLVTEPADGRPVKERARALYIGAAGRDDGDSETWSARLEQARA